jgi:hypothetical protein
MNIQEKAKEILSQVGENEVLCMRNCNINLQGYGYFQWPESGLVIAEDWKPSKKCGNGLHGFLRGCGNGHLASFDVNSKWLIFKTNKNEVIDLGDKIKCREAFVLHVGKQEEVFSIMKEIYPDSPVIGCLATAGDYGTATAGDGGTAVARFRGAAITKNYGTALAGENGIATSGDWGKATAGEWGTATAGNYGTATAGNYGTATAGEWGTATAGEWGTATAGRYGTALAGDYGTATAGRYGTALAGEWGTATAGDRGKIEIEYWDNDCKRTRKLTGYIGEDGLKPNVFYKVEDGKFIEV